VGTGRLDLPVPKPGDVHPGHPPVLWIAGSYRHRGPGASRRVPYGGADPPGRASVVARGSPGASTLKGHRACTVSHAPQSAGTLVRTSWVGQRALPGQHRGPSSLTPQVGGSGQHTPGCARVLTGPGPLPTSPQARAPSGLRPDPRTRSGASAGPGPDGSPPPVTTRTKPPSPSAPPTKSGDAVHVARARGLSLASRQPGLVPPLGTLQ
jgi:hypothetical protein